MQTTGKEKDDQRELLNAEREFSGTIQLQALCQAIAHIFYAIDYVLHDSSSAEGIN